MARFGICVTMFLDSLCFHCNKALRLDYSVLFVKKNLFNVVKYG